MYFDLGVAFLEWRMCASQIQLKFNAIIITIEKQLTTFKALGRKIYCKWICLQNN